jgi:hypothetical protein
MKVSKTFAYIFKFFKKHAIGSFGVVITALLIPLSINIITDNNRDLSHNKSRYEEVLKDMSDFGFHYSNSCNVKITNQSEFTDTAIESQKYVKFYQQKYRMWILQDDFCIKQDPETRQQDLGVALRVSFDEKFVAAFFIHDVVNNIESHINRRMEKEDKNFINKINNINRDLDKNPNKAKTIRGIIDLYGGKLTPREMFDKYNDDIENCWSCKELNISKEDLWNIEDKILKSKSLKQVWKIEHEDVYNLIKQKNPYKSGVRYKYPNYIN